MESHPLVPRRASPRPVGPLEGEQPSARALGGDPRALGRDLVRGRTDQVSHHLPADRRVRIKQPPYNPFSFIHHPIVKANQVSIQPDFATCSTKLAPAAAMAHTIYN